MCVCVESVFWCYSYQNRSPFFVLCVCVLLFLAAAGRWVALKLLFFRPKPAAASGFRFFWSAHHGQNIPVCAISRPRRFTTDHGRRAL